MPGEMKINQCKCENTQKFIFAPGYKSRSEEFRVQCELCGKKGPQRASKDAAVKAWNEGRKR